MKDLGTTVSTVEPGTVVLGQVIGSLPGLHGTVFKANKDRTAWESHVGWRRFRCQVCCLLAGMVVAETQFLGFRLHRSLDHIREEGRGFLSFEAGYTMSELSKVSGELSGTIERVVERHKLDGNCVQLIGNEIH